MALAKIVKGLRVVSRDVRFLVGREIDFRQARPTTSILFLTYRCNSRCKTCSMWRRPQQLEISNELDLPGWLAVVDQLAAAGVRSAEIFGGNALLRKDVLIPLLQRLYEKGMAVHLPTSGIGLDDELAEATVKYVDTVYISTDGLGDQQDEIRGVPGAAGISEDSIAKLLRFRTGKYQACSRLRTVCNCTVSRFNIDHMHGVVRYAIDRGFDEINFEYAGEFEQADVDRSQIMGLTPEPYYIRQEVSILADRPGAEKIKANLADIKRKFSQAPITIGSLNIDTLSVDNLCQGTIPHKKCYIERNVVTVDPYGNLVACPFINNYRLGSLREAAFGAIWNNERHRCFRKTQNSNGLPMCAHCILGAQRNPGVIKSLERIYLNRIKPYLTH